MLIAEKDLSLKLQNSESVVQEIEEAYLLLHNYRVALNHHAIVAITDAKGVIIHVNELFCEISKYSRNELMGKTHRVINSGTHPKGFFRQLWSTIAQGNVWSGVICNRNKEGNLYWVKTTIFPFKNRDGKTHSYVSIRTDITEQVRIQKELEKTQQLLVDEKTAIWQKNAALNEVLNYLNEEKKKVLGTISSNFETTIFPLIDKLAKQGPKAEYLSLLKNSLREIADPIIAKSQNCNVKLTPKEIQICNFIKRGLSGKEIASLMSLSTRTIEKHRENIRDKLGVDRKTNLGCYLLGQN